MHVHLVFVTKYRRKVFTKAILDDMRTIFESVCRDFEAELIEFDGEDDHVHLLVTCPPKVPISSLVNSLKGVSSRMLRKKNYPSIRKKLWGNALWSPSYFAVSCGGAPSASSGSTSNNNKHHTESLRCKDGYAVRAIHPRPEGRGFLRYLVKLRGAGVAYCAARL